MDGEVVALGPDGNADFSLLQDRTGLKGLGVHRGDRRATDGDGRAGHAPPRAARLPALRPAVPRRPLAAGRAARGPQAAAPARHPGHAPASATCPTSTEDGDDLYHAAAAAPGRGHHRQAPALDLRPGQAVAGVAQDQDPARAGAGRGRLRDGQGLARGPRLAAGGHVRGGRVPVRGRGRQRHRHQDPDGTPRASSTQLAADGPTVVDPPRLPGCALGASRASSSGPSSRSGPRTACCARPRSRASSRSATR